MTRADGDLFEAVFGGQGIVERVENTPSATDAWQARVNSHQGRNVTLTRITDPALGGNASLNK
jgi:hypothetical protein